MAKNLVIVESPAKAKTIKRYLGSAYEVTPSVGHIVDLPKSTLGVDLENDFKPEYHVIPGKAKVIEGIKKSAQGKENIYLATDPDREGEAIAWHIAKTAWARRQPARFIACCFTRSPQTRSRPRSRTAATWTKISSTHSRRGGCSTVWSATR